MDYGGMYMALLYLERKALEESDEIGGGKLEEGNEADWRIFIKIRREL